MYKSSKPLKNLVMLCLGLGLCLCLCYVVMLCYVMLCYVTLCYVMLCYVMLSYVYVITLALSLANRGSAHISLSFPRAYTMNNCLSQIHRSRNSINDMTCALSPACLNRHE